MAITKIVVTGGPCGGKSTAMIRIQEEFQQLGYTVLFVPETATELITGGVAPWTCKTVAEYQFCQLQLQLEKERVFAFAAKGMPNDNILIVCDRGAIDNKAYVNETEWTEMLTKLHVDEAKLRDSYDAVFHLVSVAKGASAFYSTESNLARTETPEQAALLDDKLIAAWAGHPYVRVIDVTTACEDKIKRLIAEIAVFLDKCEPK